MLQSGPAKFCTRLRSESGRHCTRVHVLMIVAIDSKYLSNRFGVFLTRSSFLSTYPPEHLLRNIYTHQTRDFFRDAYRRGITQKINKFLFKFTRLFYLLDRNIERSVHEI